MPYIEIADYKAVVDAKTLDVIHQTDPANLDRAELYAIEEISGYLRSRYDVALAFAAIGTDRNQQLVMTTCDVALYHLIAWLPQRIGFEIREIRYKRAIEWLVGVQAGKISPNLPGITDPNNPNNSDFGNPIKWGSIPPTKNDW